MSSTREALRTLLATIAPVDDTESTHLDDARAWVASGLPLHRTAKPATPPKHLVAYSVLVDPDHREICLADHRLSGLWLPTGGHVDPGERPEAAAERELGEELGIEPAFHPELGPRPLFLTVTPTVGPASHVDVSLWYVFVADHREPLSPEPREFHSVRWWPQGDLRTDGDRRFDPHMSRFVMKLQGLR